jgi:hypothetical protein
VNKTVVIWAHSSAGRALALLSKPIST